MEPHIKNLFSKLSSDFFLTSTIVKPPHWYWLPFSKNETNKGWLSVVIKVSQLTYVNAHDPLTTLSHGLWIGNIDVGFLGANSLKA